MAKPAHNDIIPSIAGGRRKHTKMGAPRQQTDKHLALEDYCASLMAYALGVEQELERDHCWLDGEERRRHNRITRVFRLVQVEHANDEGLATCKNISDAGAQLTLDLPVSLNDVVKVNFTPSCQIEGRVVWVNGPDCGIAFDNNIDSMRLLTESAARAKSSYARPPRLPVNRSARLIYDGRCREILVKDASQRGLKVTHDGTLTPGLEVKIVLDDLTERKAVVRWTSGNIAGIMFHDLLPVSRLASARNF